MAMQTTLREARRRVARTIGFFLARTVTSGSVSSLTDNRHPVKSGNIQDEWLAGKWILRPDAGSSIDRVRVVAENGYTPASGMIQPDTDWSTPPQPGEVYELHGALEPWDEMLDIINTALQRLTIVSEIAVAASPLYKRHGLNDAAPWLRVPWHVRQIGWLETGQSRNANNPFIRTFWGWPVADDGSISVEHPYTTFSDGDTLYIKCLKPAYYACRPTGGTFGEQSGLVLDTDECPVDTAWLAAAAAVEYWERYAGTLSEGDPDAKSAEARQMKAAAEFDTLTATYMQVPPITWRQPILASGLSGRH